MSQTKSELGLLALQALKVVEGDATPDANDTSVIEAAYDNIYAALRAKHLVSWGSGDSIPDECVDPVMYLVAKSRISFFKPPSDSAQLILMEAGNAESELTEVLSNDYVEEPTKAQYF
jgi:hypothetical protein